MSDEEEDLRVWVTKDGRKINIVSMTNEHLMNTVRLLEKFFALKLLPYLADSDEMLGDAARDSKDASFNDLMENGPAALDARYTFLLNEAKARNLTTDLQRTKYREQVEGAVFNFILNREKKL